MSDGDRNPASTPTAVPDVHGDGRWMSQVRCSAEPHCRAQSRRERLWGVIAPFGREVYMGQLHGCSGLSAPTGLFSSMRLTLAATLWCTCRFMTSAVVHQIAYVNFHIAVPRSRINDCYLRLFRMQTNEDKKASRACGGHPYESQQWSPLLFICVPFARPFP